MPDILITGATRTAIGAFNGMFTKVGAVDLGTASASASLANCDLNPSLVDEVIFGNVLQAGLGQNPARQIAIKSNVPISTPAFTVNQVCGSGMKAVDLAWKQIKSGDSKIIIAGGTENMTQSPYILPTMRNGARLGSAAAIDTIISDALSDALGNYHMGITAENIAVKYDISRQRQDEFALESQKKYAAALENEIFKTEITPLTTRKRGKEIILDVDEHPRADASASSLASLKAVFKKDGTVTPGNASGINDGAASMIVLEDTMLDSTSIQPNSCVKIKDIASCGCEPELMGLGPIYAVEKLLKRQKMNIESIDVWEINEAFASQSLAVIEELKIDPAKVNVNGGAIALGHPVGASGARIIVTLLHEMKRKDVQFGVATLCVGGGMGLAILLENIN